MFNGTTIATGSCRDISLVTRYEIQRQQTQFTELAKSNDRSQ